MELTQQDVDAAMGGATQDAQIVKADPPKAMAVDRGVRVSDTTEALRLAQGLWKSGLVPNTIKSVEQATTVVLFLRGHNLDPIAGMGSVYLVGNRPALYGDAAIAVCYQGGDVADVQEWFDGDPDTDDFTAHCSVTRFNARGERMTPREQWFSVADAKTAGLLRNQTYAKFLRRMLMWRARHAAFRDAFPDRLMGMDWAAPVGDGVAIIGGPNDGVISTGEREPFTASEMREPDDL